jgi:hypothetical protein
MVEENDGTPDRKVVIIEEEELMVSKCLPSYNQN